MWKRFRWVLLGITLIIVCIFGYKYWQLVYNVQFHGKELDAANVALAKGISVDDAKDDFVIFEKNDEKPNENNPSPYRLPVMDIKNLKVAADDKYMYIKIEFYGEIENTPPIVNGDAIDGLGAKIDFLDKPMGMDLIVLHMDFGWWPYLHVPVLNTYYATGPTGIEWPEDARFTTENRDCKIAGGKGTNYILGAFPLKTLELKKGDTVNIDLQTEAKSRIYDHAAVDVLRGESKSPGLITWKIGTSTYTIDNDLGYGSGGDEEERK